MLPPMMEHAGWELRWPPSLLASEARWLLGPGSLGRPDWPDLVGHLLDEAFVGPEVRRVFSQAHAHSSGWAPFGDDSEDLDGPEFLKRVAEAAHRFPERKARPYWPERRRGPPTPLELRRRFVDLVENLRANGYLDREFPKGCVDEEFPSIVEPSAVFEQRLGVSRLWPLGRWPLAKSLKRWDDDTFYGVIEVIHDLVSRPRRRWYHADSDRGDCGWHWEEFARGPGQVLYRWRVNRLLERSHVELRLADEGEDTGRLVAVTDEARAELVSTMAQRRGHTGDQVRHALALFRRREANEHDKRSAIVTLYGILEQRRDLLKEHLYQKDEGALFTIANEFALRHQAESQKADYDPVFLDWVFWWYLATIELTDRLLARQSSKRPS